MNISNAEEHQLRPRGLSIETLTFREAERDQWTRGNRKMLTTSGASPFLKQVLVEKARVRPNRFFGEAFVASHVSHDEGYYCSFKWLTSATWTDRARPPSASAAEFKQALRTHFPRLTELQARARTLSGCLRHSLLIRQPICVRAATRTMTARLG